MWLRAPIFKSTIQFVVELYGTSAMQSDNDPYKSSSFIGHSLWMCPSGAEREAYSEIIAEASSELGTFQFLPHITLVAAMMTGAEDVVGRTKKLASQLAPYQFEFDEIQSKDAYFQCVSAKMKRTDEAVHANALAREAFPERKNDSQYVPHLSLVYGDYDGAEKEQNIMPKLREKLSEKAPHTLTIPVDAIEVWSTQGDVKNWYLVETIPLTGNTINNH